MAGERMAGVTEVARVKPRLRGVSHEIAAYLAAPAWALLFVHAETGTARTGALTYGASLFALFLASAVYHRPTWSARARRILWRVDHSAIFLLIAGTYTPLCLLLGDRGRPLLAAVWLGAAAGVGLSIAWVTAPKALMAALYVLLGWLVVPVVPALHAAIGPAALALLLGGGLLYTVGAVIYALRRPDPFPAVFGFHEIFHLLVVAAAACHFAVVAGAIRALR
ncbi:MULTISPECIES: PAQR family membrane homeostasis protein TrhA [Anaeromyxobacter]|uniref:PAQR family membrane homeostasis protein TrhA n=1 Tax=Anaeromyxobacter TaxID=161492 RepID=UPI001F5634E1|nr:MULTISPECIES: hemolysin III family protein [unclassified Anaeromyxobacter]